MENEIAQALTVASKDESFIDLIQSNFTKIVQFPDPELFVKKTKQYFEDRIYSPDAKGLVEARKAIADLYSETNPETVFITASTSESYSMLFNALIAEDSEVLLPQPSYPLFEYLCNFSKIKPVFYKLNEAKSWQPEIKTIEQGISPKTRAIILISPNNPTGSIISNDNLAQIIKLCKIHKLYLIVDEVFSEFHYQESVTTSSLYEEAEVPTFVLNGISKMLALPDLKIAWVKCNSFVDNEIYEKLELVNDTYLNANYLLQFALPDLLLHRENIRIQVQHILNTNLQILKSIVSEGIIECRIPEGGIHAVISIPQLANKNEEEICLELLKEAKLNLHPGYFYDYYDKTPHFVISLLQNSGKFEKGLSILKSYVIQYASAN